MIDLHSHILPGIDDGAATLAESVEMARAAAADGIEIVAATPHVRDDYPTDAETMERLVSELRDALARAAVPLELRPGGEIAFERLDALSDDDLRRFGLGGSPTYLLLEFPYVGWPLGLEERVFALRTRGFVPVLAHPERNGEVQERPALLEPLVRSGTLVQVTAASLDGRLGSAAKACARTLIDRELAHVLASDAHAPELRAIGMSAAVRAVRDDTVAQWLTVAVPRAIVEDLPIPRRR